MHGGKDTDHPLLPDSRQCKDQPGATIELSCCPKAQPQHYKRTPFATKGCGVPLTHVPLTAHTVNTALAVLAPLQKAHTPRRRSALIATHTSSKSCHAAYSCVAYGRHHPVYRQHAKLVLGGAGNHKHGVLISCQTTAIRRARQCNCLCVSVNSTAMTAKHWWTLCTE
jgi:hypothetical protein